ncbi:hypothetical protein ACFQ60_10740 [Streptomyces zhihengii]
MLQRWAADERCAGSRLVVLTRHAVLAVPDDRAPDPAAAAVWGLVRAAQSEEPGRFLLADTDGDDVPWAAVGAAIGAGEPQIAVRAGPCSPPGSSGPRRRPACPCPRTRRPGIWTSRSRARWRTCGSPRGPGVAARPRAGARRRARRGDELPRRAVRAGHVPGRGASGR